MPELTLVQQQQAIRSRFDSLYAELAVATSTLESEDWIRWGCESAKLWPKAMVRRVGNVVHLFGTVWDGTSGFVSRAYDAAREGKLSDHLVDEAKAAYRDTSQWIADTGEGAAKITQALKDDPKRMGPELLILVCTSLVVSGGPDGDGGVPDLDLLGGIGAHRSLFTHSIFIGSALETAIFSLLTLVTLVHDKLPAKRDPWWDWAHKWSDRVATRASQGASIGMAYHLFVDGLLQPGTYHGLPFAMSQEGHDALAVLNAQMEALDVPNKAAAAHAAKAQVVATNARPAERTPTRRSPAQPIGVPVPPAWAVVRTGEAMHLELLSRGMVIDRLIACHLSIDHVELIRKRGAWMKALHSGEIEPLTRAHQSFVDAAHNKTLSQAPLEQAWHAYRRISEQLGLPI